MVHSFRRSDPVTALFDVAAHALSKSDGKALTAAFDLVAPGGRPLLKAGKVTVAGGPAASGTEGGAEGEEPTIGSEQLGGASVIVRRA